MLQVLSDTLTDVTALPIILAVLTALGVFAQPNLPSAEVTDEGDAESPAS